MDELAASEPRGARLRLLGEGRELTLERFAAETLAGLTAGPKTLPCAYLYDATGSRLFEEICALPEYYPTRAEEEILRENAAAIAADLPAGVSVVELGSGSATKTRHLLEALLLRADGLRYVPVDISRSMLEQSSRDLLAQYPTLQVLGVAAEYSDGLRVVRREVEGPEVVLWLGSNVGNLDRADAIAFLADVRADLDPDDRFLLGVDLRKDVLVLERAYDDAAGVTAAFNKNLLARINRELGGDFDLDAFAHRAPWNAEHGRMEMHLESLVDQTVRIDALELDVAFARGETIHTESSHKYSLAEIDQLAARAGFALADRWLDAERRFSLQLLRPEPASG
jgi:dimethylhistidine N-methyltransferase